MGAGNVKWVRLGDYIEQFRQKCANNNAIVSGVDINKQFIPTRANIEGIDISGYYLVPPTFFAVLSPGSVLLQSAYMPYIWQQTVVRYR